MLTKIICAKYSRLPADKESAATLPASRETKERKRVEIALAKARNSKETSARKMQSPVCSKILTRVADWGN